MARKKSNLKTSDQLKEDFETKVILEKKIKKFA